MEPDSNLREPQPGFQLDDFQKRAMEWVQREHSVLVSAPTGSGKTVIAECAIETAMQKNEGVIYTAPIKALSNQKYRDFKALYGEDKVGIVTGDISLNPEAPIVIMTTEIYRNSLFENSGRIQRLGWVIFDEIHYLNDPERGTVWEEAILFTPAHVRILALSATVPNIEELAAWIGQVHENPIAVIQESTRPVPLEFLFQCQGRIMSRKKQLFQEGYLGRPDWYLRGHERHKIHHLKAKPNRLDHLLIHLRETGRLPAIYFVFGRRRAEYLAEEALMFDFLSDDERVKVLDLFDQLIDRYQLRHEKSAEQLWQHIRFGIGYHHAGMLPTLKEVVERLFTSRLLKLIFTTETFALGINMPARAVVFDELQKFYGNGFRNLTTRDFYQMAGRAGRRGMDEAGYVYSRINPHHIPMHELDRMIHGSPEPISSQFNTAYATLLHLYRTYGERLLDIYPKSLHHFQASKKRRRAGLNLMERKIFLLKELGYISPEGLTARGEFASTLFGYELLLAEMHADHVLESLTPVELCVLLAALVYEPRKVHARVVLGRETRKLERVARHYERVILQHETKYRIEPVTKRPEFHLSAAVQKWAEGREFDELFKHTEADEGEIVRIIRMVIQLLRELMHAPRSTETLREIARTAITAVNRGVVDAEKQLRT